MNIPYSSNLELLRAPLTICGRILQNRFVIQPMEGCDGTSSGEPDKLTRRRYDRFAKSGAAIIWAEAITVVTEGRANPRQLYLNGKTADSFKRLIDDMRETAHKETGVNPIIIAQLTHSGRYSKPVGPNRDPIVAQNNPLFEGDTPLSSERIITDDALRRLEEIYPEVSLIAADCGFDGVDIKACHGYLISELLGAHTRKGPYGGSFENRTRFIRNLFNNVRTVAHKNFIVTSRINIYDGYPYPYGWGVRENGSTEPLLTEPIQLLKDLNPELLNITMGNPYQNPRVNRPLNCEAMAAMAEQTKKVQDALPDTAIVASAVSFERERIAELAAGYIEAGVGKLIGYGRMSFAYPDLPRDILSGAIDNKKVCITCSKCTELMRAGGTTGCVMRDKVYTDLYREICNNG